MAVSPDLSAAILTVLFFVTAVLYAAVGQAGASGYLAAMAFAGTPPEVMKPTALVLNVVVATIGSVQFIRARQFSWPTFWPLAAGSLPFAFAGGAIHVAPRVFGPLIGAILLLGAALLVRPARPGSSSAQIERVPVAAGMLAGGVIGFLAGLTATGGAIFLTPLLVFMRWGEVRGSAGVSAAFVLVNSLAGLAGALSSLRDLPTALPMWGVAAAAGGLVGAGLGSRVLAPSTLRRILAAVLVVAALKLILTG